MQIIRDQQVVDDDWQHVEDGADLPDGKIFVTLDRWNTDRDVLIKRGNSGVGVKLSSDQHAEDIAEDLEHLAAVALDFPVFRDGRPFSTARLLRDRYNYQGEIRAVGDVLRDQIFYMHRCGINAFEVRSDRSVEDAVKAFEDFTVTYQPAADEDQPLWRRRG